MCFVVQCHRALGQAYALFIGLMCYAVVNPLFRFARRSFQDAFYSFTIKFIGFFIYKVKRITDKIPMSIL